MTSTDPLAHERFRTILSDRVHDIDMETDSYHDLSAGDVVDQLAAEFPEAHFEYRTNEQGVRVRKVVVKSREEVDPNAVIAGASLGEQSHDAEHCHNSGRPHLGPCGGPPPAPALGVPWEDVATAAREDHRHVREMADGMQDRLRAAINTVVAKHGIESFDHRLLRWALTGERPVEDMTSVRQLDGAPSPSPAPALGVPWSDVANANRPIETDELSTSVARTYGPHPFVRQAYKGRQLDSCAHFTQTSSYEATQCGAPARDPIHADGAPPLGPTLL